MRINTRENARIISSEALKDRRSTVEKLEFQSRATKRSRQRMREKETITIEMWLCGYNFGTHMIIFHLHIIIWFKLKKNSFIFSWYASWVVYLCRRLFLLFCLAAIVSLPLSRFCASRCAFRWQQCNSYFHDLSSSEKEDN